MRYTVAFIFLLFAFSVDAQSSDKNPLIIILGVAQDAGYPQIGCEKACCKRAIDDPSQKRMVVSFALVEPETHNWWLFEATPDIKEQLQLFRTLTKSQFNFLPKGVFLTHGHIGHYTGLMYFGREAMNTHLLNVYAMPRMKNFLITNGPWSQLVSLKNIELQDISADSVVHLSKEISVTHFLVPHRDEFTETVGFNIHYHQSNILFIPDIDKWNKFHKNINEMIQKSSVALLDGTFYKDGEIEGRPMNEIPHPFIEESMQQFSTLSMNDKKKIYFIHFNHTNPLLDKDSKEYQLIKQKGFENAEQGMSIALN
jgi:pyrroloquinoline quinone biosynthesis protein B